MVFSYVSPIILVNKQVTSYYINFNFSFDVYSKKIKIDIYYKMYEKIQIVKDSANPMQVEYESDHVKVVANIEDDSYLKIFEYFSPNVSFSMPDVLIQDMVEDGSVLPTFKKSLLFTNEDFDDIVKAFKNDFDLSKKKKKSKSLSTYMRRKTKKFPNEKKKIKTKLLRIISKKQDKLKRTARKNGSKPKKKVIKSGKK